MLKRLSTFLFGGVVGAAIMYVALIYHVVRAPDGVHLIPKTTATLRGCYVDIREYGIEDWKNNPDLTVAISASGKTELLTESAVSDLQESAQQLWDELSN